MKQLLSLLLMLFMAVSVFAVEAEIDGLWYNLVPKAKQAEVIQYKNDQKYSGDIVIPATIEYGGVTYNVTSIGFSAFGRCNNLTSVTIANSVTSIGNGAFNGCTGLTSVAIPESVISINLGAFANCTNLTLVTIGNSVISIGDMAFENCSKLASIVIPSSITSIGSDAFRGCIGLSSVHITDLSAWCNINFYTYGVSNPLRYAQHLYLNGEEIIDLIIPDDVTSIANWSFHSFSGLKSVLIPNSVNFIGDGAFFNCSGLTSVTIPNSVAYIDRGAFQGCSSLTSINIPNSVTNLGRDSSIGGSVFQNCGNLTSVTIGNGITSIFRFSFKECSKLATVFIGTGIKSIDQEAFANCPDLEDFYCYAETVPTVTSDAFDGSYVEYARLLVPDSLVNSYRTTSPWNRFGSIVSMEEYGFNEEKRLLLARYDELLAAAKEELAAIAGEVHTGELIQIVSQLSSPYTDPYEGSLTNLLDGNTNTFWHSNWRNGNVEGGIHYLQVDLINPADMDIYATFTRRPTLNDHVTNMSVYGTNNSNADKAACEELLTFACPYTSNTETITSPTFNTKGYRYLRFYANATTSNRGYWHISEFQLYSITSDPDALVNFLDGEDVRLLAIINEQANLARYQIGEAEYNALKEAYDALMAKLKEVIDAIKDVQGDGIPNPNSALIYDLNGRSIIRPQKGINIIRRSDGTTRKVVME